MFNVAIKNFSTVISDAEADAILAALQVQVSRDFAPAWGVDAQLSFHSKASVISPSAWMLGIFDDADQPGALGYHDVTASGTPLGKVFAKTTLDDGGLVSVTASHELLEMLLDPWVNLTALDPKSGRLYAYEACDAVEADELGYMIAGVQVSDFVLPNFFEPDLATWKSRSHQGHVHHAFQLSKGGYLSYIDLNDAGAGWQQVFAKKGGRPERRVGGLSRVSESP